MVEVPQALRAAFEELASFDARPTDCANLSVLQRPCQLEVCAALRFPLLDQPQLRLQRPELTPSPRSSTSLRISLERCGSNRASQTSKIAPSAPDPDSRRWLGHYKPLLITMPLDWLETWELYTIACRRPQLRHSIPCPRRHPEKGAQQL